MKDEIVNAFLLSFTDSGLFLKEELFMLPEMIKSVVKKLFAEDYPHLKLPANVYAKVRADRQLDAFE